MRFSLNNLLILIYLSLLWTISGRTADSRAGHTTVTGESRVPITLQPARAERVARDMAERDAKQQILLAAYGKSVPPGGRLIGELRGVTFSAPEFFERGGRQMVRVVARYNPADIGPLRLIVDDRVDMRVDELVAGPLESHQPLMGGGAHIFWGEDGWICIGVGFAPTGQGDAMARKAAQIEADANITEVLHGVTVTVQETAIESLVDMGGFAELRREVRTITRLEVEGALRLVQTAGSWYTPARDEVAIVRVVGVPPVELLGLPDDAAPLQVRGLEMEDDWRDVLRRQPALLSGGAAITEKDGAYWLVAVGSAKTSEDPKQARQAEIVAKVDAQRAILKFANGFTTKATDEERSEFIIIERGTKETVLRDTEEAVRRIRQEATGTVPGLTPIGRWRSADGSFVFAAFAARL